MQIRTLGAIALVVACCSGPVSAQSTVQAPAGNGTGAITGTVRSAGGARPLRGARVILSGVSIASAAAGQGTPAAGSLMFTALTNSEGRFTFSGLPPGRFVIEAGHDQFLPVSYGQRKLGRAGAPIDLADGQQIDIVVSMMRGSAITGTVVDEFGEPLVRAHVRALRFITNQNGVRRLRVVGDTLTDDRGIYRFFQLEPADYWVSATPSSSENLMDTISVMATADGPMFAADGVPIDPDRIAALPDQGEPGYAPTYHPSSSTAARATRITADGIAELSGVDIQVLPNLMGTIRGVVTGVPNPKTPVQILLHNPDAAEEPTSMTTMVNPDGSFALPNVAPGNYLVYAQTLPGEAERNNVMYDGPPVLGVRMASFARLHGRLPVVVDRPDAPPIAIALLPGRSISGRVVFDMNTPQRAGATPPPITISITPAPQSAGLPAFNTSPQTQTDADGNFTLPGIRPGRYFLRAAGRGAVQSVEWNGLDTLDFPLEVTTDLDITGVTIRITDRVSEVSGAVTDAAGKPGYDCTVIAISTDRRHWLPGSRRVATSRPGPDGRYVIRGLPAGDYRLAVVTDYDPASQFDSTFLQQLLGGAVNVSVSAGSRQLQNLRMRQ